MKNSNFKENLYISLVVIVLVACMVGASFLMFFYGFDFDNKAKVASAYDGSDNSLSPIPYKMVELTMPGYPDVSYTNFEVTQRYVNNADAMANAYTFSADYFKTWFSKQIPEDAVIAFYEYSLKGGEIYGEPNNVAGKLYGYSYTTSTSTAFNRYQCGWYDAGSEHYRITTDDFRFCYSPTLTFAVGKEFDGTPSGYYRLDKVRVYYFTSDVYPSDKEYNDFIDKYNDLQSLYDSLVESLDYQLTAVVNTDTVSFYNKNNMRSTPTTIKYNNISYSGYYFYRSSVESAGSVPWLCRLDLGVTVPKGQDLKIKYDLLTRYQGDNNVDVYMVFTEFGAYGEYPSGYVADYLLVPSGGVNQEYSIKLNNDVNYIDLAFVKKDTENPEFVALSPPNVNTDFTDGIFMSNFQVYSKIGNYGLAINDAYNSGFSSGERQGYQSGYNKGYAEATYNSNNYTFTSLIGAVVDAPVSAFRQMFNFEVLGVNLSSFFMAMLTACLIIVIVKIALGGK